MCFNNATRGKSKNHATQLRTNTLLLTNNELRQMKDEVFLLVQDEIRKCHCHTRRIRVNCDASKNVVLSKRSLILAIIFF